MSTHSSKRDDAFIIVLCVALVLGMLVGLGLCAVWRYAPSAITSQMRIAAVAICPPFLLAGILEATTDSTLALIMTVGTIVFANAFLYGGLASFAYFLMRLFLRRPGR
jgi:hypothetical protein